MRRFSSVSLILICAATLSGSGRTLAAGQNLPGQTSATPLKPSLAALQEPTLLVDLDHRKAVDLDGNWHMIVDPYQSGLYNFHHELRKNGYFEDREPVAGSDALYDYDFALAPTLKVPGDWNTQNPKLYYYEGLVWYERHFDYSPQVGQRVFLHIGAANYEAKLFINGQHICDHEGGFTPFDCEVTDTLKTGTNSAVIAVDNTRHPDGVPTEQTDWWNYGGLTRDVSLVAVPKVFIDDYNVHLSRSDHATIVGYVHLVGAQAGTKVHVRIPELAVECDAYVDRTGLAEVRLRPNGLSLWGPGHPKLYTVEITSGDDHLTDEVGFRTIEVDGTQILLNGEPIFLRGIAIHAEAPYRTGRAYSEADVNQLLDWTQELGANFVRLAHYPHDQRMTRETDRRGILVWSEVPVYWAIHFEDPAVLAKSEQQLSEMIRRDRNKASIAIWSIANETPNTEPRTKFLAAMAAKARELDDTRLISAALLVRGEGNMKIVDDPLGKSLDVLGTNEYVGWYEKTPAEILNTTWSIAYQKPLIMTEFGAGAKAGLHSKQEARWSEEYQATLYRNQIVMLNKIPQLRGMSPWLLMDFRSPNRIFPGLQDDFNRKGLISSDGQKKLAFFVLQHAYQDHAVGKP